MIQAVFMAVVWPSPIAWISRWPATISPSSTVTPAASRPGSARSRPARATAATSAAPRVRRNATIENGVNDSSASRVATKDAPHTTTANSAAPDTRFIQGW